jgi:hypothetical protein
MPEVLLNRTLTFEGNLTRELQNYHVHFILELFCTFYLIMARAILYILVKN